MADPAAALFCDDEMLAYDGSRRTFLPGEALTFDEAYRLAHLPLVAPGHPEAIARKEGRDYASGRYATPRFSLVAPVDATALEASPGFSRFEQELRSHRFSDKIEWRLNRERATKLHATIVNGLAEGDIAACAKSAAEALAPFGRISIGIGGPFLGRINSGRIYLPVYPERRDGADVFSVIQAACGARQTRFYVVGYYHLHSALTAAETSELAGLVERWRRDTLAILPVNTLAIQATNDDLALSARNIVELPLVAAGEIRTQ
ncbi:MAG: hypothetical protein ABS58_12595 [Mesorhizobium sp. SCN 65-20]|nr:MAG: hypothetical protein ABS58_12595 [Mesorhizobium sp. SCN 65-20]